MGVLCLGHAPDLNSLHSSARKEVIAMPARQRPGEKPARPGEYVERGPRGGKVPNERTVTIERGDPKMPPTQKPGRTWEREGPPQP